LAVDHDRIASLRSYVDPDLGIKETFLQPNIGGGHTVGVLSTPLDATPTAGWVICHSFAHEHVYLQSMESAMARRLAATGYAVLRFHSQGYGDSELGTDHITLGSHVDDAGEAAGVLAGAAGVARIGFAGIRLGGTVAALAANGADAPGLMAVAPAVDGADYVGWMTKQARLTEVATGERSLSGDPIAELMTTGILDVLGFPLRREVYEEIRQLDLSERLRRFRGQALVLQVSRGSDPDPDLRRLAERLRAVGARADLEVLADPAAARLGLPRYRTSSDSRKEDVQAGLTERVVAAVARWGAGRRWDDAGIPS